jgi:hypothetical protein
VILHPCYLIWVLLGVLSHLGIPGVMGKLKDLMVLLSLPFVSICLIILILFGRIG